MRLFLLAALFSLGSAHALADTFPVNEKAAALLEIGRRIYQEGVLESGASLRGVSAANVIFEGKQAACMQCHRKSGLGSSEGKNVIRPITGGYLFAPAGAKINADDAKLSKADMRWNELNKLAPVRNAYMTKTFARALRDGLDSDGVALDRLMPRYGLSDREVAALEAYLRELSSRPDPGVDQATMHFATVIMPGVDAGQSRAMLEVLNGFISDLNGGTRSEVRRRKAGTEAMYRAYRRWELHVWNLTGAADGWQQQLEEFYRKQPVFALISGMGGDNWHAVEGFCERSEIPCLFPNTVMPVKTGGYYSFYFSRGLALEADVLSRFLSEGSLNRGTIVQVYREDDKLGSEAAHIMQRNLQQAAARVSLTDWTFTGSLPADTFQEMLKEKRPQALVMWVNDADLERTGRAEAGKSGPQQIYVSASLLGEQVSGIGADNRFAKAVLDKLRMVSPYALPDHSAPQLQRIKRWLSMKKIVSADEVVQANTYFAVMVAGDAVSHMLGNYSRDYFIEKVEHMVGRSWVTSVYPRMSLGPGQRFASRGAYVLRFDSAKGGFVQTASDWIIP